MSDLNWSDEIAAYDWDRGPGFPDTDAAHPFPDGNSASGWGTSNSSTFHGVHTYPGGDVQHVARVPGGGGFSGMDQPERATNDAE
jgi:hypothetical protein